MQLYKPQGVGYYYTNHKVESDDIFVHSITDDWEEKWKKQVSSSIGGHDINQIKDESNTFHASARKLPTDSVFTVLFTEEQIKLYKQYGGNCIYMDATHSLTQYGYYVISLGVEDVHGKGRIVGYCITDSTDAKHVTAFLEAVKQASPEIEPLVIVTDDDNAEWSAVQKVFPKIKRFLCQFHVRKSWGFNLNKCGAKGEIFNSLQEELQVLIAECDESSFYIKLDAFKSLSQRVCVSFHDYFVSNWCTSDRINMWAQFPRDEANMNDVTTNNYIESYHNILKNDPRYFDKKANKRFDKLILVLLQHEKDQNDQLEHVRLFGTLLRNDRRKQALISGQAIADSEVRLLRTFGTNSFSFIVQSQTDANKAYEVTYCKQCCCSFSNDIWCNHALTCSCPIFKARHRPCKHIGAVFRIHKQLFQGVPKFQSANTASVSHLGDENAVSKRVVARLGRMEKDAANLKTKLSALKAAVEECTSQQGMFLSSTDHVAIIRKLDAVEQALQAACNCADVVVVAPAPVVIVVPALVPIANIAPGSHFIKQKLYRNHKPPGRKKNPTMQPVGTERRALVANAMQTRGIALQAEPADGTTPMGVEATESESDQQDFDEDDEGDEHSEATTNIRDAEVRSFYVDKIYLTTNKLLEYEAVSPEQDRDLWYTNRMYRIGASSIYDWIHLKDSTNPIKKVLAALNDNVDRLQSVPAVAHGLQHERTALLVWKDVLTEELQLRHGANIISVNQIGAKTHFHQAVPFLEAQTDGLLEIKVKSGITSIQLPQSSGVWIEVLVPEHGCVRIITEAKNPKPVASPEEWIGNSTVPLQRNKEGYLHIKRQSATFYQIVMQMALSGHVSAYLVAHMPTNPEIHTHWREHMHVELLEFKAEFQSLCKGWVQVLLHRWNNICLVPFAAHWKRHVKPTSVQRLCSLEDMDDEEYDGLRYRHCDLFTCAAAMHNEEDLAIDDPFNVFADAM